MNVDYLCRVCGESGLLSYTAYQGDKPSACRHRMKTLGNQVVVEFFGRDDRIEIAGEPDSELGMGEPLGPISMPCDRPVSHGEDCPGWIVACSCGYRAEYVNELAAIAAVEIHGEDVHGGRA
jgi:hypothetical protein